MQLGKYCTILNREYCINGVDAVLTHQVNEPGRSEPDADEDAGELRETNAVARAQNAQVLEDVGEGDEAQRSQETQTQPLATQVDSNEGGRDSEVVDDGVHVEPERQLVICSDQLKSRATKLSLKFTKISKLRRF